MAKPRASNIELLPLWKKNATPHERMMEVAHVAREHPEKFGHAVVIYIEDTGTGSVVRYANTKMSTMELLGILRMTENEVLAVSQGRA